MPKALNFEEKLFASLLTEYLNDFYIYHVFLFFINYFVYHLIKMDVYTREFSTIQREIVKMLAF